MEDSSLCGSYDRKTSQDAEVLHGDFLDVPLPLWQGCEGCTSAFGSKKSPKEARQVECPSSIPSGFRDVTEIMLTSAQE